RRALRPARAVVDPEIPGRPLPPYPRSLAARRAEPDGAVWQIADLARRHAADKSVGRHVARDNRARGDDRTAPDGHASQHRDTGHKHRPVLNCDRQRDALHERALFGRPQKMALREDAYVGSQANLAPEPDRPVDAEHAAGRDLDVIVEDQVLRLAASEA